MSLTSLEPAFTFITDVIARFPNTFDQRLEKGYERLAVNSSKDFLVSRHLSHLKKILLAQFFLQKKMEASIQQKEKERPVPFFLRLFECSSRLCLSLVLLNSYEFSKEKLVRIFSSLLPSILEIPRSALRWHHPELPYFFVYFEAFKLRGERLSKKDLRRLENSLREHLLSTAHLTPALFWPYNEEESHRQIQLLLTEVTSVQDPPHVSIHFQEQTPFSLKFLIHLVRPKNEPLGKLLARFPDSFDCFCHFQKFLKKPFPIELAVFSLKIPSSTFEAYNSINLLYARRYVLKYLENAIGPYRDYNGGLFEKQQRHFEILRVHLSDKIPNFDLFAEKVFYALNPVEVRLSLSLADAKELFLLFSELLRERGTFCQKKTDKVLIIKSSVAPELQKINSEKLLRGPRASVTLGDFHYLCFLGESTEEMKVLASKLAIPKKDLTKLNLVFQEGAPHSLNPYHSSGDMRCRILNKLLFEGLTRLNAKGKPELAGAKEMHVSEDKLLYTFKLRPHYWSNGEKVTAIDYVTGWGCAFNDAISHPESLFILKNARSIKEKRNGKKELGIRALDAETLQVELEKPDSTFLYKLAQPFFFPLFGSLREPKWFNGPYLVREQNKERILLEKNPYFWNKKKSFFKQIEIKWNEDISAIYASFQEGKVNWVGDPLSTLPSILVRNLKNENLLKKQKVGRRFYLFFNTKNSMLSSPLIRRALSSCLDRKYLCENFFPEFMPLEQSSFNPDQAKEMFEKGLKTAGFKEGSLPPLTIMYSNQAGRESIAHYVQAAWHTHLNIDARLEKSEWNVFRNKIEKGHFEICGTIQEYEESADFLERFEGLCSWNFSGWENLAFRNAIKQAKLEKSEKALSEAKKILQEEAPFTPLFTCAHLYACTLQLHKYTFDKEGCIDFSQARFKNKEFL